MTEGKDPMVDAAIEQEERVKACAAEVGKILEQYGCVLSPQVIIGIGGTRLKVDIVMRRILASALREEG